MDDLAGLNAALEQLNAGAPIATIDPYLVQRMWEALSRIPRDERQHPTAMIGVKLDPSLAPDNPEGKLAMLTRYALLNALIEAGVLDEYIKDEALRKKVFTAAALWPCGQNELGEAVAQRELRQSPPGARQKKKEELRHMGYDPDHLKVTDKFIDWLQHNC